MLKKNTIYIFALLLLVISSCNKKQSVATTKQAQKKPNLVFVFTDQQSYDMLGCYGNIQLITPALDEFSQSSVQFNHAISNTPVCTGMRSILFSGQHPLYNGCISNDLRMLPSDNKNYFADMLNKSGYNTGYIGKWHLYGGDRYRPVPEGEFRYGFNDLFLTNNCTVDYSPENSFFWNEKGEKELYNDWEWMGQTKQALKYLDEHANKEEPFAMFLSWHPPHNWHGLDGYGAPQDMLDLYDPDSIKLRPGTPDTKHIREMYQGYYALTTSIDRSFEQLMKKLEEKGIKDETIIVFTSDHGDFLKSHNQRTHKSEPQAVSCRVPLLIRYPEKLKPRKSDLLISTLDLMPTLLGLMDIEAPKDCQGLDLTEAIYTKNDDAVKAVPLFHYDHNWRGIYTQEYTYAYSTLPNDEADTVSNCLYQRKADPYEQNNLFNKPEFAELKADLHKQTWDWMSKFNDKGEVWKDVLVQIIEKEDYDMLSVDKGWFEGSGSTGILKGRPVDIIRKKQ